MEIGPDEEMPVITEDAKLVQMLQGEEEVEKYDKLLSLAVTGGDYNWMQQSLWLSMNEKVSESKPSGAFFIQRLIQKVKKTERL